VARGKFVRQETTNAPIPRLFANLSRELAPNTNDLRLTCQLARLESMAYATNLAGLPVERRSGRVLFGSPYSDVGVPASVQTFTSAAARDAGLRHLTNAISLFERSVLLLQHPGTTEQPEWVVAPVHLGLAWCLDQAGRKAGAVTAYRRALAIAWRIEVAGDYSVQQWLREIPDHPAAWQAPTAVRAAEAIGPGVCYSHEISNYLLPLLDPRKDARETAGLKTSQGMLKSMPRAVTPILVALEPGTPFEQLVAPDAAVPFDLDGSGFKRKWGWITPKAAWLVYVPRAAGRSPRGSRCSATSLSGFSGPTATPPSPPWTTTATAA